MNMWFWRYSESSGCLDAADLGLWIRDVWIVMSLFQNGKGKWTWTDFWHVFVLQYFQSNYAGPWWHCRHVSDFWFWASVTYDDLVFTDSGTTSSILCVFCEEYPYLAWKQSAGSTFNAPPFEIRRFLEDSSQIRFFDLFSCCPHLYPCLTCSYFLSCFVIAARN